MKFKLVGIGEVLWDVYPDAAHFGGAPANFACHAASLGAAAWMVSAVGADDLGERALAKLREHGVDCDHISRDEHHATGRVLVTLNKSGQPAYEFAADPAWDHLTWSDELSVLAEGCDAVCFGTLSQRSSASRETIRRFISATPATALRVFDVNPPSAILRHGNDPHLAPTRLRRETKRRGIAHCRRTLRAARSDATRNGN